MKIAFHFTSKELGSSYGHEIYKRTFGVITRFRYTVVNSIVLVGDFLAPSGLSKDQWAAMLAALIDADENTWKRIDAEKVCHFMNENVFILCFESITKQAVEKLDNELQSFSSYIGAFEIDDSNPIHYNFYSGGLITYFRIMNNNINIITPDENGIDIAWEPFLKQIGFEEVKYEFTGNLYRSVFDKNHTFESARLIAEWKKSVNDLFGTVADTIIDRLFDAAPELGIKLWSALSNFEKCETTEQLAQVMTSCRRIFEYVTDCLFPATDKVVEGHSLKKDKYKNRLMQFAIEAKASNTNIDLIVANTTTLFEQWDKLLALANKGVHDEVYREETRRCLIRTVILLDDIVCLRTDPFEKNVTPNMRYFTMIDSLTKKYKK
jgi:hypothetical protein